MYGQTPSYRGGQPPAYQSLRDSSRPLFDTVRKGNDGWERIAVLCLAAAALVFFLGFLYQSNRVTLLTTDFEQLNSELRLLKQEATSLRASLSNQDQEKSRMELDLKDARSRVDRMEASLNRATELKESLQKEMRTIHSKARTCETDAKKREEELEADLAVLTQERNDLKIRVDTEHAMSTEWAKSLAEAKKETEKCQNTVKLLTASKSSDSAGSDVKVETTGESDVDLGRKAAAGEEHETVEVVETQRETSKGRKDLD